MKLIFHILMFLNIFSMKTLEHEYELRIDRKDLIVQKLIFLIQHAFKFSFSIGKYAKRLLFIVMQNKT